MRHLCTEILLLSLVFAPKPAKADDSTSDVVPYMVGGVLISFGLTFLAAYLGSYHGTSEALALRERGGIAGVEPSSYTPGYQDSSVEEGVRRLQFAEKIRAKTSTVSREVDEPNVTYGTVKVLYVSTGHLVFAKECREFLEKHEHQGAIFVRTTQGRQICGRPPLSQEGLGGSTGRRQEGPNLSVGSARL